LYRITCRRFEGQNIKATPRSSSDSRLNTTSYEAAARAACPCSKDATLASHGYGVSRARRIRKERTVIDNLGDRARHDEAVSTPPNTEDKDPNGQSQRSVTSRLQDRDPKAASEVNEARYINPRMPIRDCASTTQKKRITSRPFGPFQPGESWPKTIRLKRDRRIRPNVDIEISLPAAAGLKSAGAACWWREETR